MTPDELTALEEDLRERAKNRAFGAKPLPPESFIEWNAANAIADLRRKLDDEEATFDARVQEMSERFRAVNVVEALKQLGPDRLAQIERAEAAEAELARLKDRVAGLAGLLEQCRTALGCRFPKLSSRIKARRWMEDN